MIIAECYEINRIKEDHTAGVGEKRKHRTPGKIISKVFPVQAMKAYRGSRGIAPLILNLSTSYS